MIEYIHEPTDLQCGQAVLAMVLGKTVEEIVIFLQNDRETTLAEMKRTFKEHGVHMSDERIKYVHDMTTERDIRNQILTARNQGVEQGIQQGKEEDASNLLKLGIDIEVVSRATGLSVERISALRAMPPDKVNNQ